MTQNLSQFSNKLKNLTPIIGVLGGRYFYDSGSKTYCCMNDIVRQLNGLSTPIAATDSTNRPLITAALIEIERLDGAAESLLKNKTKDWSFFSCMISVCTRAKRFFGNMLFDRKAAIENLRKKFISVVTLPSPSTTPVAAPTSPAPVAAHQAAPTPSPSPSVSFATTSFGSPATANPNIGFSPSSSGFGSTVMSSTPPLAGGSFELPNPDQFLRDNNNRGQALGRTASPNSSASTHDLGPFAPYAPSHNSSPKDVMSVQIPALDWGAIKSKGFKESQLGAFQNALMQFSGTFLRQWGFLVNEQGLPCGLDVKTQAEVSSVKNNIKRHLKDKPGNKNHGWITSFFTLLSDAGMAGYADQIRTFWAGSLNLRGARVAESYIKTKQSSHYPSQPQKHEDRWIEAIRKGHANYKKAYLEERGSLLEPTESYETLTFEQWNLRQLYSNPGMRKQVLGIVEQRVGLLKKDSQATIDQHADLLKKLTFLNPRAGFQYQEELKQRFLSADFKKVWEWALRLQLKILGKEKEYDTGKEQAQKKVDDLQKIYDAFGKQKIHPRSIEVALGDAAETQKIIRELIQKKVIKDPPDVEGFYTLGAGAANFGGDAAADSNYGRVAHLLSIAQGAINGRYAARRLAPTFYTSQSANDNFDIPTHSLPALLQYEDLRKTVVEQVKGKFMELLGVTFDASQGKFVVQDAGKIQFIANMTWVDNVPFGPSVVSVFLDSIVSLGEKDWAFSFCQFLKSQLPNDSGVDTGFWDFTQNLSTQFEKAIVQIESVVQSYKDDSITPAQEMEYQNRRNRLVELHRKGQALVRVISQEELIDPKTGIYNGTWKLDNGPNLSTTLIPRQGSSIEMALFCKGIRGVLLDPHSVADKYFGKGFLQNGFTQMDNFWHALKPRTDGESLEEVQQGLAKESAQVELGQRTPDRAHTEIAYFRPAERNLVQGLFFKVNDENFATSLRELIELQKTVLDTYGFFLPIFAYKDRLFQEVVVDAQLVQALGMQDKKAAKRILGPEEQSRKSARSQEFFNIYGTLDTQTVIAGKEAMQLVPPATIRFEEDHINSFKKLFDLQLMVLQLKGPQEKISFMMQGSFTIEEFVSSQLGDYKGDQKKLIEHLKSIPNLNEVDLANEVVKQSKGQYTLKDMIYRKDDYKQSLSKERPVDLSLIDNLHLIFPTIFPTGNRSAEAQNLFFSHSNLMRFMLGNSACLECWTQMVKRNMKVFLGVDVSTDSNGLVQNIMWDRKILSYFKDSEDPTGHIPYAKCLARLVQCLILLGKKHWADAIKLECRKQLGNAFGRLGSVDYFENSPEIQDVIKYLGGIKNPNFQEIKKLPEPHGSGIGVNVRAFAVRGATVIINPTPSSAASLPSAAVSDKALNEAAVALNYLYHTVWGTSVKPQKAAERGLLEHGDYPKRIAYHLVGANLQELQNEKAFDETRKNAESIQVFYLRSVIKKDEVQPFLVNTAVRTTNGDLDLLLPKGENKIPTAASPGTHYTFLTDTERRRKRFGLVKVGRVTVTAKGGYNSPREKLAQKVSAYVISTAGPQFEKYGMQTGELEVADFIVKKNASQNDNPLFKEYYDFRVIPSHRELEAMWNDVKQKIEIADARGAVIDKTAYLHEDDPRSIGANFVRLRNGDFFLMRAFKKAIGLHMENLLIPAMKCTVQKYKFTYLKATALGAGFFASLGLEGQFQTSLRKYVIEALVDTYVTLIGKDLFDRDTVLDFPFYKLECVPDRLKTVAEKKRIEIIWQDNRDLLDFSPALSLSGKIIDPSIFERVIINAGDVFAFDGNEARSVSLDAQLGNNSDFRQVFNWHFNHHLLDQSRYHGI